MQLELSGQLLPTSVCICSLPVFGVSKCYDDDHLVTSSYHLCKAVFFQLLRSFDLSSLVLLDSLASTIVANPLSRREIGACSGE
mmetsp:Transcript_39554/g.59792  ORF Transcript_39554/g.59792 Transcript_39554/m.59792 type:complete len:84 (+) Transcript_39554:233-484(+)